jgi:hypothetical protein
MRFLEESKHHHLPRIKQFKTHILYWIGFWKRFCRNLC